MDPAKFEKSSETNKKDKMTLVKQRCEFIISRDIDDQRILESNWTRGLLGQTQPRMSFRRYHPSIIMSKEKFKDNISFQ